MSKENWEGLPFSVPSFMGECDTCGFKLLPSNAKLIGVFQDDEGEYWHVCSVCFQVMVTMNREVLYKGDFEGEKPMGGPYRKAFMVGTDGRWASWDILDKDPWLEQTKKLEPTEKSK